MNIIHNHQQLKIKTNYGLLGVGGSLQKDLNLATQALEDVAMESANVAKEVSKEVLNPLAKFTKVNDITELLNYS